MPKSNTIARLVNNPSHECPSMSVRDGDYYLHLRRQCEPENVKLVIVADNSRVRIPIDANKIHSTWSLATLHCCLLCKLHRGLNLPPASPNADYDPKGNRPSANLRKQGRIARDADRSRPQYAAQSEASSTDQKRLILKLRACRAQFSPRELSCLRRYYS